MTNEITMSSEIDYDCEDFNSSKRPKMTSKVWEEMQRIQTTEGSKVLCKYCGKLLQDNCGTSHLKRHLVICPKRPKPVGVVTQDPMSPAYLRDSGLSKALMVRPLKVEPQSQVICFSPTPNYGTGAVTIASIDNASNSIVELNHKNSPTLFLPSLESRQNQEELSLDDDVEMKAFYASLDVETSFKSPSQDTTVITESSNTTTPSEETSKALKTLQDLLSKDFSVLLQTKQCGAMKSTIEYLSKMSSVKGISSEMKLLILEVSREFTRWSCDYNNASKKIESASSNITKADKLEESLEANKNEFKEVLSLENELCNQLATLEQRNGILCLADQYQHTVVLWNPSIRKFKKLPPFQYPQLVNTELYVTYGFGYDPVSDHYKVVALYNSGIHDDTTTVQVLTLGTHYWRRLPAFPFGVIFDDGAGKCVCGTVNWLAYIDIINWLAYTEISETRRFIVSFDLAKESYQKISLPPDHRRRDGWNIKLFVWRDCLGIIFDHDVWVMETYGIQESWVKLFSVSFLQDPRMSSILTKASYICDGQLLLELKEKQKMKLIVYDSKNDTFKVTKFLNTSEICVESLLSPDM